ncbi:MAG: HAD-IIIA family hydrolase [Patescibacteria group bacterium]
MNKGALRNFIPDYKFKYLTDINSDFFNGVGLIIFDVDNTLVFSEGPKGYPETKKEVLDWFNRVNSRYKCICLSNSRTIFKIEKQISELLNCNVFLSRHKKPFKKLFEEIKAKYSLGDGKVFVVGDRIFTDILFGNINGAVTVLVKPLNNKENILIKIIRKLENSILFLANLIYT